MNKFALMLLAGAAAGGGYVGLMFLVGTWPSVLNPGYSPVQPEVPFSHRLHAGELKLDCRYCHNTVDKAAHAAIPANKTCTNCHSGQTGADGTIMTTALHTTSPKLQAVRESEATGRSVEWEKVHDLADYVYFNHSIHVNRGVACVSCHGRIDKMEQVRQVKPLSMSWCLECHRNPTPHLRHPNDVTNMEWVPEGDAAEFGKVIAEKYNIKPNTSCSTCHR